jgi:Tfp pilus assembly protein PilF
LAVVALVFIAACASDKSTLQKVQTAQRKYAESLQFTSPSLRPEMYSRLKEAVALDPLEPTYHMALANAYVQDNRLDAAETEFLQTIQLEPNFSDSYKQLGRLYMEKKEYDKALTYLSESLKKAKLTNPQMVRNWVALCQYQLGHFEAAELSWLKALDLREDESIRLNMALAYLDRGQFDKATEALKKALEHQPQFVPAHYHLALLYLKDKDLENARRHFNEVVRLEPQSEQARSALEYMALIKPGR